METVVVFTSLARVGARAQLVHGQGNGLMSLFRERSEAHGTRYEVLNNRLYGLHLVYIDGITLEVEEVTNKYRRLLFVYQV